MYNLQYKITIHTYCTVHVYKTKTMKKLTKTIFRDGFDDGNFKGQNGDISVSTHPNPTPETPERPREAKDAITLHVVQYYTLQ